MLRTGSDKPTDPDEASAAADAPGGLALPPVKPGDPAASAVQAALASGLHWLRVNEPGAREGAEDGVHHLRTTTRRLRTALSLYRDLTDSALADRLADELKWLGGQLGGVRDLDVLTARLRSVAQDMGTAGTLSPLFESLGHRHDEASVSLREALRSDRYTTLIGLLTESIGATPTTDAAWEPCRDALPPLVDRVWQHLRKAGEALTPESPDDDFHEVRKRAKRARYAAEAVVDVLDSGPAAGASRFARRVRRVQDVLGEHQDAVIAASEIHKVAAAHPDLGPFNLAAGRLLEHELRAAADSRDRFFDVWDDLERKKALRWLKP